LSARTHRGDRTRELILDVAERLFAHNGPSAVTVRTIAAAAGINTQAVNYHFGSKDRLFEEMFERRIGPVNRERLERLAACTAGKTPPLLEDVIDAFVRPILRLRQESLGHERALVVMQFQARAIANPGEFEFGYLKAHFEPVRSRFISALCAMLPGLAVEDVVWRYNFMCGAILYSMAGPMRMLHLPESHAGVKLHDADNEAAAIDNLVQFLGAGFRAASLYRGAAQAEKVARLRTRAR
jgi:AcrR family transcriptional regulator